MRVQFERLFPGLLLMHEHKTLTWQDHSGRLYDTRSERYLYPETQDSDFDHEKAIAEQWLTNITCLQTLDGPTLKASLKSIGKEFKESPFATITDLSISNIHDSAVDYHGSWACNQLYSFLAKEIGAELGAVNDHSGGLLLIYGIANAQSMCRAIAACRPRIVLIIEDRPELCCAKLDEEDCQALLTQLSRSNTSLFLITESDPEKAYINAKGLIEATNILSQEKIFSLSFRDSDLSATINKRFGKGENMLRALRLLGFFIDEIHMSMNASISFTHAPPRVIKYNSVPPNRHHAVIVASGPSLKESFSHLRSNRNRFHLFSCYSTLRVMLSENIEPDFHCNQERHATHILMQEDQKAKDYAKRSILLCSANNDPRMNRMYKDVVAFFRSASSATALFTGRVEDYINAEGSQVVNLALFFSVLLGYRTIHLFGADLGTSCADQTRIEGAYGGDERNFTIAAPGNRRKVILTSEEQIEVGDYMGLLANGTILPEGTCVDGLKVYNYSDGLKISGTISAAPEQFNLNLGEDDCEKSHINTIIQLIPRPSVDWGKSRFLSFDWQQKICDYTSCLREWTKQPFDMNALEDYLQASERQINALEEQVMPRLMAGSLTRAWYFILMTHDRLSADDKNNPQWKAKAVTILHTLIESMEQLLLEMVDYVERLDSVEQHQLESTVFALRATRIASNRSEPNNG